MPTSGSGAGWQGVRVERGAREVEAERRTLATAEPRGRALLVLAALDPKKRGSLEDQLAAISRAVVGRGAQVVIAFARSPSPAVASLLAEAGASCTAIDFAHPAAAAAGVLSLARRIRPALIHCHFLRPLSPPSLAARMTGAAVVHSEHMALSTSAGRWGPLKRAVLRRATTGVMRLPVSRYVARTVAEAEATPAPSLRVIENGVDLARFRAMDRLDRRAARAALGLGDSDGPAIACVARMALAKGVDVAIEALAAMRAPSRPILLVVGDGPDQAECEARAGALGVGGRVRFLGLRDDVEEVLAACHHAWVPSRGPEAFGLAAAEAMAARLPVVASRIGGLPEVVEHEVTGLLVRPADPAALGAAADALLADEARARRLGEAGRARAEARFSVERYRDALLALYRERVPGWLD